MDVLNMHNDMFRLIVGKMNFTAANGTLRVAKNDKRFTNKQHKILTDHINSFPKLHNLTKLRYKLQFKYIIPKNGNLLYTELEKSDRSILDNNIYSSGDIVMFNTNEGITNAKKHGIIVTTKSNNGKIKKTIISDEKFGLRILPKKAFSASKGKNYDHIFKTITKNTNTDYKDHYEKLLQALQSGKQIDWS